MDIENKVVVTTASNQTAKYLTFGLALEEYGLEILKVQEIIGMMEITCIPKMPPIIRGVINLRGKLVPVIDMREKFLLNHQEDTEKTCIIVVQIFEKGAPITIGILVDFVSEVLDIPLSNIEPPPSFGSSVDVKFILGMGKITDKVVIILDIDKILTDEDNTLISSITKDPTNSNVKAA